MRFLCFGVFRFKIATSGQEHIPPGGYLLVGRGPSRLDGPVRRHARAACRAARWFLGSGPSTFTSRWRESLHERSVGCCPVWRGGVGIEPHVASAKAVLANGGVFVQMPEGTVSGPPGRLGAMRPGWAIIAMRTGAPVLPIAIAGTEELYIGRRMASRVLPADVRTGAGRAGADASLPEPARARSSTWPAC